MVEQRVESFSGPLPPPNILREYDLLVPGSAGKVIDDFIGQTIHRQSLEKTVVTSSARRADQGLWLGFVVVLAVLAIGAWLTVNGYETAGTVALGIPLPTLAGVFVYGRNSQRAEREKKAKTTGNR